MPAARHDAIESPYAWARLAMSLLLMTIGGSGMYSITVVLPRIQQDFGVDRGGASLPYTLTMIGFGIGGILMGRLADRFGVMLVVMVGAVGLGVGYIAASFAPGLALFCLAQGLFIGLLGTSATFAPLVADTTYSDTKPSEGRNMSSATPFSSDPSSSVRSPPIRSEIQPDTSRLTTPSPSISDSISAPRAAPKPRSPQ